VTDYNGISKLQFHAVDVWGIVNLTTIS